MNTLKSGARLIRRGVALAASTLLCPPRRQPACASARWRASSATEVSAPRIAAGGGIAGRRELRFDAFGRRFELRLETNPGLRRGRGRGGGRGAAGSGARTERLVGPPDASRRPLDRAHLRRHRILRDRPRRPGRQLQRPGRGACRRTCRWSFACATSASKMRSFAGDLVPSGRRSKTRSRLGRGSAAGPAATLARQAPERRRGARCGAGGARRRPGQRERGRADEPGRRAVRRPGRGRIAVAGVTELTPGSPPFVATAPERCAEGTADLPGGLRGPASHRPDPPLHRARPRRQHRGHRVLGSVCNANFAASLSEGRLTPATDWLIAAHEIGHTFNAPHDGERGACASTPLNFIMAPSVNPANRTFSDCSVTAITAKVATARVPGHRGRARRVDRRATAGEHCGRPGHNGRTHGPFQRQCHGPGRALDGDAASRGSGSGCGRHRRGHLRRVPGQCRLRARRPRSGRHARRRGEPARRRCRHQPGPGQRFSDDRLAARQRCGDSCDSSPPRAQISASGSFSTVRTSRGAAPPRRGSRWSTTASAPPPTRSSP